MATRTQMVTIARGASLSAGFDASKAIQVFVGMPLEWDARAQLTFQYSPDGGTIWFDAFSADGTEISYPFIKGGAMRIETSLARNGWLRFRSGTRRYPVTQKAGRIFILTIIDPDPESPPEATTLPVLPDEPLPT